jgi:GNAT superfamily N-acetyltransferase
MINIQPTQLINHDTPSVGYRRGEVSDSYVVFKLFEQSVADLSQRFGSKSTTSAEDTDKLDRMWSERHSLYEHLARTADQFWIAERDGKAIGFARSIVRDGVRQLTELFVLPGEQSGGIGRELISRAFPADTRRRSIIATTDARAQALYLSSGVYPRFPLYFFARQPEPVSVSSDLEMERIYDTPQTVELLSELDKKVLGFRREVDQRWFLSDREGIFTTGRANRWVMVIMAGIMVHLRSLSQVIFQLCWHMLKTWLLLKAGENSVSNCQWSTRQLLIISLEGDSRCTVLSR